LTIQNLLSFGPQPTTVELRNLNVLIGANGSGKTNLIEVLGLLQSAPKELGTAINNGGGIDEWLWKGERSLYRRGEASIRNGGEPPVACINAVVEGLPGERPLRFELKFAKRGYRFELTEEIIAPAMKLSPVQQTLGGVPPFYARSAGRAVVSYKGLARELNQEEINPQLSILAQLKDIHSYPEITSLSQFFESFRLHRDWEFGSLAALREPCDAYAPDAHLEEDCSNLGAVLGRLLDRPEVKKKIIDSLRIVSANATDLRTRVEGGKIQTRLEENHLQSTIPMLRMSDGTVRWLTLLAILLDPEPPPVVCIEEPELGLHPDMIQELAKLLVDASNRTQLIITTHSERLVEEFTETPEAVVVCEKENGVSRFQRLDREQLSAWLSEYSLGQLWVKGHIGGTRW
jgi:predicted ATPase